MSCTVIIDAQFGSCGKAKVAFHEARQYKNVYFVRTGGPNSGHHVHGLDGREHSLRQLGAGAVIPDALNFIAAGCVIDEKRLLMEIEEVGIGRDRLIIDPRAVLLEPSDSENEQGRVGAMGTTASGNGEAMIRRMRRTGKVRFSGDSEVLRLFAEIRTVAPILHDALRVGHDVVVEGVQGFGLSLFHSTCYPFCTSRDTSASAFASEVGLAPRHIDRVVGVMRTFPIRVGGNSGPLKDEIDWETVARESGAPASVPELTSVTRRLRRVGRFDTAEIKRFCDYNLPDALAVMGVDRLDYAMTGKREGEGLSDKVWEFITNLEAATGTTVAWIGTGPHTNDIIRSD